MTLVIEPRQWAEPHPIKGVLIVDDEIDRAILTDIVTFRRFILGVNIFNTPTNITIDLQTPNGETIYEYTDKNAFVFWEQLAEMVSREVKIKMLKFSERLKEKNDDN